MSDLKEKAKRAAELEGVGDINKESDIGLKRTVSVEPASDSEIGIINGCKELLDDLDFNAQVRVLQYLTDRVKSQNADLF